MLNNIVTIPRIYDKKWAIVHHDSQLAVAYTARSYSVNITHHYQLVYNYNIIRSVSIEHMAPTITPCMYNLRDN